MKTYYTATTLTALGVRIGGNKRYLLSPPYTINANMDRMEIGPKSAAIPIGSQVQNSTLVVKVSTLDQNHIVGLGKMTPRSLVDDYRRFGEAFFFLHKKRSKKLIRF
jgi:hypothetical protein